MKSLKPFSWKFSNTSIFIFVPLKNFFYSLPVSANDNLNLLRSSRVVIVDFFVGNLKITIKFNPIWFSDIAGRSCHALKKLVWRETKCASRENDTCLARKEMRVAGNDTCLARNEMCVAGNDTCLARNEICVARKRDWSCEKRDLCREKTRLVLWETRFASLENETCLARNDATCLSRRRQPTFTVIIPRSCWKILFCGSLSVSIFSKLPSKLNHPYSLFGLLLLYFFHFSKVTFSGAPIVFFISHTQNNKLNTLYIIIRLR